MEFKREKRKEELAELEQTIERVQQQQVSIKAVEQIEAKPLPLTSKVAIDKEDYQTLVTAAQNMLMQEKQESKLKKLLKEAEENHSRLESKNRIIGNGTLCDQGRVGTIQVRPWTAPYQGVGARE